MGRHKYLYPHGKLVMRKNSVKKSGENTVKIIYCLDGKSFTRNTDVVIKPEQWDAVRQKVVNHTDAIRLNNKLDQIKRNHDEALARYDGIITESVLRKVLDGEPVGGNKKPPMIDFIQFMKDYNQTRYESNDFKYSVYINNTLHIAKFEKFITEKLAKSFLPINELTLRMIDDYKTERLKTVTANTFNSEIAPIKSAIRHAIHNKYLDIHAFSNLNKHCICKQHRYTGDVDDGEGNVHFLTKEQMQKFIEYYPTARHGRTRELMDLFLFSFHACGLCISDIVTLEWKHIDFEKKRIEKTLLKSKNYHEIYLNDYAMSILEKWKKMNRNERFVFNLLPANIKFTSGNGGERNYKVLKDKIRSKNRGIQMSLQEVGKKIGITDFNLSMYVARHTFAIWALNDRNVSLSMVSRLLGDKSIVTTEKNYGKFMKDKVDDEIMRKVTFDGCLPKMK